VNPTRIPSLLAALLAGGAAAPALTPAGRGWVLALSLAPLAAFLVMLFFEIQLLAPMLLGLVAAAWRGGAQPNRP